MVQEVDYVDNGINTAWPRELVSQAPAFSCRNEIVARASEEFEEVVARCKGIGRDRLSVTWTGRH